MAESSAVVVFRRIGAEFGRLPVGEIERWLADALLELDTTAYGDNIERAKVYMACHLLKLSRLAEKGVEIKFNGDPDADLKQTRYGLSLLRLRGQTAASTATVLTVLAI